jgi:hypothetical protein
MSAVRKPEIIPIRSFVPAADEPPFTTEDQMFSPPESGEYDHSEADLRVFWSRIWRTFKSLRLCEGFLQYNKLYSLETWGAAFELSRQARNASKEENAEVDIWDVKLIASRNVEPPFTTEDVMMVPPTWGPHTHSEADLRAMWRKIWHAFKNRRLCEGFLHYNKIHPLDRWRAAFEEARQRMDGDFDNIRYVKRIADTYELKGTPEEIARKEAEENQRRLDMKKQGNVRGMPDADDPDIVAFQKRSKPAPIEDMANHPVTQRIRNRNRGQ